MLRAIKILLAFLTLIYSLSCSKESPLSSPTLPESQIPNFANINPDKVLGKKESHLKNKTQIEQTIAQYYQKVWEEGDLWGGFLVAKGNKILYEKYRGYTQYSQKRRISKHSALHTASVSKPMTAMAILKLVESGKLNLNDPLTRFFPQFPYPNITIKLLLNHRSGLPKYEHFIDKIKSQAFKNKKKFLTNKDILNLMITFHPEPVRAPDTGFMYCNTNYVLLALIIENITKTPYPEAMKHMVFEPLKMKDTYVFQEKDTASAAKSFYAKNKTTYPYDLLDGICGDKNIYTTPRDLFNFSRAMFSKNFLRKDLMAMIFEPYSQEKEGINNYGLGFRMKIFDNGQKLTYHNGWWHGSNTVFVHLPGSHISIIALGNKYSRRIYSAVSLASLFDNFPMQRAALEEILQYNKPLDNHQ